MAPLLYAHRGASAERPENTIISFRRALELGADVLEMDAHMTADGAVVISHDPTGARLAGAAAEIRRSTLAEVQAWDAGWGFEKDGRRPFAGQGVRIPTLAEVLAEFPGVPLNVDLKQEAPSMVEATLEVVRGHEEHVLLASFSSGTLRKVRRLGYRGATCLGQAEAIGLLTLPRFVVRRRVRPGDAAQLPTYMGRRWIIEKAHAVGLRVDIFTVNDPAEGRRLLDLGVDGLMADDPAALVPLFRSAGPRG